MNRFLSYWLFAGWFVAFLPILPAQNNLSYGLIPTYLLSGPFSDRLQYSFSLDTELNAVPGGGPENGREIIWRNLDLEAALSYDLTPDLNLAAGIQYRISAPEAPPRGAEWRPWQQLTLINRARKFRLRHRFRLEERFVDAPGNPTSFDLRFRLRYRFSADFPLQGERLDPGEFYLNLSNELLTTASFDNGFFLWQNRSYAGLGYQFSPRQRLEAAPEWRIGKSRNLDTWQNLLLLRLTWVSRLKSK